MSWLKRLIHTVDDLWERSDRWMKRYFGKHYEES